MLNPPHDQSRPYRTRFFIHLHLPAPFAIRVRHATTGSYACFASQPTTSSTRQLSLHIDVTLRLLPLSLITQQQHCVGMPVPLRRLYIFKFSDYPRPAMCIRACHTLIATAIDRILHVYLPALSYDILRHMSGYVRLLLLTYLLSPRTHAFLIVITSFLSLDLRRYCFLFFFLSSGCAGTLVCICYSHPSVLFSQCLALQRKLFTSPAPDTTSPCPESGCH